VSTLSFQLHRRLSGQARNLTALSTPVIVIAVLSLLGISLYSSVLTFIVLAAATEFGRALIANSGLGTLGLGVGFVIGGGLLVFAGQILLLMSISPYLAHSAILCGLLMAVWVLRKRFRPSLEASKRQVAPEVLLALSISLLVLAMRQPWLFAFALPLLIFERVSVNDRASAKVRSVSFALLPVGWLAASTIRPDRWWHFYQYNDTAFFESIGWSIAHWGVFEYPGFVGSSISGYHWFAYAFFGVLSHLSGLEPWDALTKFAPLLLNFCLASIFVRTRNVAGSSLHYLIAIVAVAGFDLYVLNSLGFSVLVAIVFVEICTASARESMSPRIVLSLVIASVTLFLSKTSTAVVVAIYLGASIVFGSAAKRRQLLVPFGTLSIACILTYLLLFTQKPPSDWLYWEIDTLGEVADNLAGLLGNPALVAQYILWIYALRLAFARRKLRIGRTLPVLTVLLLTLGTSLTQTADEWEYFGFAAIPLATYFAARHLAQYQRVTLHSVTTRFHLPLLALALTFALTLGFIFHTTILQVNEGGTLSRFLGDHLVLILASSGPLYLILGVVLRDTNARTLTSAKSGIASLLLVIAFLAGSSIKEYRLIESLGTERYTEEVNGSGYPSLRAFGGADLVSLGRFVRENTSPETVLASNYFCCYGSEWWKTQISAGPKVRYRSVFEIFQQWGGADFRLVAETRRRFSVQGNFHISGFPNSEQIDRMNLVLDFATSPTQELVRRLKSSGVSGYVVYLPNTPLRDWSEFAVERFRSGNFVFLEFNLQAAN